VEQLLAAEPGLPATDVRLWTLRGELAREERELARATETVHHSIVRALGAYPPLAVQACAMAVRTAALLADVAVQPTFRAGSMVRVPTALHRALVTATMLALRRAADRACDGVLTMVAGNRGDGTRVVTHVRLLVVDDASRALSEMGAAGVDAALASALAHVTMLGAVEHHAAEVAGAISWLDRLALWHDSDEELTHAQLRERARWHRAELELHLEYALATMGHVTRSLATCQLRDWLVALHDHAEAIDVTASDCMICSLNPSRDSAIEAARRCGAVLAAVGAPPPLIEQLQQVFEALRRVRSRRSQFRNSTNNTTSYSCRVIGHNAALDELRWWTWNLCAVVGTPPSNGDLLAWFLTQTANGGTAAEARPPC
jgi:hypothetical protein